MTPNPNPSPECNCARRHDADQIEHQATCAALSQTLPAPGEVQGVGVTGPCANCGAEGSSVKGPDKLHPYRVICKSCGASTAHHASWRASNDAWNRRPTPATVAAANDEGVARIEFIARVLWADGQRRLKQGQSNLPRTRTDFRDAARALLDHPALATSRSQHEGAE